MKRKLISLLLCAAMTTTLLVGCGAKEAEAPAADDEEAGRTGSPRIRGGQRRRRDLFRRRMYAAN